MSRAMNGPSALIPFDGSAEPEPPKGPNGIGMWIAWNGATTKRAENGAIVLQAQRAGLKWLAVKSGESGESTVWLSRGADLIARCHDVGIRVYTWNYSHPDTWPEQCSHIARVLAAGADGHIIDAETEWEYAHGVAHFASERKNGVAREFMTKLRSMVGDSAFLAHAPIWRPQSHPSFPYVEFGEGCDAIMPQAYWTASGLSASTFCATLDKAWADYVLSHPTGAKAIWPIGPSYGAGDGWDPFPGHLTAADVDAFLNHYSGVPTSFFSWDAASQIVWDVLRRRHDTTPPPTEPGA